MRFIISKLNRNPHFFLKECGYAEIRNPHQNHQVSFARSLNQGYFYPRFHIYIEESPNQLGINLHLDAKKPSYEGSTAHSGEYDGAVVIQEMERVKAIAQHFLQQVPADNRPIGFKKEKSLFEQLVSFFFNKK